MRRSFGLLLTAALLTTWGAGANAAAPAATDAGWDELVSIDEDLRALRSIERRDGVPALDEAALAARQQAVEDAQRRLAALDPQEWSVAGKVDFLLVWARANGLAFEHRVTRPWARDPIFHLGLVRRVPYVELPFADGDGDSGKTADDWRESLAAVPAILAQAETVLTEPLGELARLAIFHLENFDGVGQGQPYRDDPPEGTLGWYDDLCRRIAETASGDGDGDLKTCAAARDAVARYRDWLAAQLPEMTASAGIGIENLGWYFHNVRLLPHDVREITLLGEREFHRYRAAYEITRNRNRDLPELELTRSAEQHESRTRQAEREIRAAIERQKLLTIPPGTPETFDTDTFWSPRAATDRHFWEELQFRNAFNNHIHASFPGHRFDGRIARALEHPIRRGYGDSSRAEGWATYLEEMFLLAGLTREVPRADELFYVALMKRAGRIYAETAMHAGTLSLEEANRYLIDYVPYMEPDLGRYDLEVYLRRPGLGSGYILGKIQLEKLLAERALALGADFDLGAFHDEILGRGMIPLTLVRWELTGADDEVREIWKRATGRPLPSMPPPVSRASESPSP